MKNGEENNKLDKIVDKSLLKLDKKLELNESSKNIIDNKFMIKPVMKMDYKSKFLTKDKLDFLEEFKKTTIDITNDKSNEINRNIEIKDTNKVNDPKMKYIQMDLDLGVLDILPKQSVKTGSTMDNSSCISLFSDNFEKNDNISLNLNESNDNNLIPNLTIKNIDSIELARLLSTNKTDEDK